MSAHHVRRDRVSLRRDGRNDRKRDLAEAAASVLVGTLAGAIAGGMLSLPVYLINWFSIERMRHPTPPVCVALGRNELFYERVYLDARWHPIDAIFLKQRPLPHLEVVRHRADSLTERLSVTYFFLSIIHSDPATHDLRR
jgi:hypothetical protein